MNLRPRILLLSWLLLAVPSAVQAQFTYTVNNRSITITGYTGSDDVVTIPDEISNLAVTAIGTNAFANNDFLFSVAIPNSVTDIGASAFDSCYNVESNHE
jgi:hypothetical protein